MTCFHEFSDYESTNFFFQIFYNTDKSLSEAFILTSTKQQYDKRLFIDLPVQYMKTTSSEQGENMLCTQIVFLFLF